MNQKRPLMFKKTCYSCAGSNPHTYFVMMLLFLILMVACRQEQAEQVFMPAVKIDETEATAAVESPPPAAQTQVDQPTAVATAEIVTPASQSDVESAANADVTFVAAKTSDGTTWTFNVTVAHPDTGWEDYADGWDVVLPDGTVVKPDPDSPFTRLLLHPHETEQPFTRSQSGIVIPTDVASVLVRAHDLVDGFGGKEVVVDLTAVSGEDFTVER